MDLTQSEFVDLIKEADQEFEFDDWFPSQGTNFIEIPSDIMDSFGGQEAFLDELQGEAASERRPSTENYFIVNVAHKAIGFDEETAVIDLVKRQIDEDEGILDADNDGRVLLCDHERYLGSGRIGNIEGSRDEGTHHKQIYLVDYCDLSGVEHRMVSRDLSIPHMDSAVQDSHDSSPALGPITPCTEGDYQFILREAEGSGDQPLSVLDIHYMAPDGEWDLCTQNKVITMGWDEVEDLDLAESSMEEIQDRFGKTSRTPERLRKFVEDFREGTIIVAKDGRTKVFGVGVITGPYRHSELDGAPSEDVHLRDVEWVVDFVEEFGESLSLSYDEGTIFGGSKPFDGPNDEPIELLDSGCTYATVQPNRYYIPEDWRMIATMNTLDKTSLYEMSYAFMRRWAFIPVGSPDFNQNDYDSDDLATLVENYVQVWANEEEGIEQVPEHYRPLGEIWQTVGQHRSIGPAIVEDIYEYVHKSDPQDPDYVSPIIMHVFPQLEGLRKSELESILEGLTTIIEEEGELRTVARDFFQANLELNRGD